MTSKHLRRQRLIGSAGERGRIHGLAYKDEIHTLFSRWEAVVWRNFGFDLADYVAMFMSRQPLLQTTEAYAPALLEEVESLAHSAAQPFDHMFAFQCVNERIAFDQSLSAAIEAREEDNPIGCSTIAAMGQPGLPNIVAQNLDMPSWLDGHQLVFEAGVNSVEMFLASVPGMIVLNGINRKGLGVVDNALPQLAFVSTGLPAFAIYWLILNLETCGQAEKLLQDIPRAAGMNWVIGDSNRVGMWECSGEQISQYLSFNGRGRLFHTNHPLANDDVIAYFDQQVAAMFMGSKPFPMNSFLRWTSLYLRLANKRSPIDYAAVRAALSARDYPDHPVSREAQPNDEQEWVGCTLFSVIFEFGKDMPVGHFCAGPPHLSSYERLSFER